MFHVAVNGIMGTRLDAVILGVNEDDGSDICKRCLQQINEIEQECSKFISTSCTTLVNRAEPLSMVPVSDLYADMLRSAYHYRKLTHGTFDIALGQGSEISFTEDKQLIIPSTGLNIDFGGMAKGYALERVMDTIKTAGITDAFVNFGGSSIAAIGSHPAGDGWQVAIGDPYTGRNLHTVTLRDNSLSTSGNTPHYNGHIVNPFTGRAVTGNRLSAVVATSACNAEVLSTSWLVADKEQRATILKNFNDVTEEFVYN